ncbi:SgrR family transcriptional regulator [Vibrio artabrorum]|uniref:SgrR family transcriptional regulator n=1 Tax=Vibrio artabrorum TaxID=446374 RepID=A0ABT8CJW1_9VIBR|nr:SgrR family transcriptional regulator [Vibrio artabrorum]MDN3701142.1 SgrR family transcriptional regulator [Vibrio artabrorum]
MPILDGINLFRYYERLEEFELLLEHAVTLAETADKMCTSPRHARTILKQMTERKWVAWMPRVGRNQRSTLIRRIGRTEVKRSIALEWIKESKYDRALEFLEYNQVVFEQLLKQTSGAQVTEGKVSVQLTYNRPFAALIPTMPHRNSERYLIRQIHSCLVSMNSEGDLIPNIAHHWEADENWTVWTFYLRPSVSFHSGGKVDAEVVSQLLLELQALPYYRNELYHLEAITVETPYRFSVHLSRSDKGFAALMSDLKYSLQPPEQLKHASSNVVGCGIFSLEMHSDSKLTLAANEHFHGFRSLTDKVTIWSLNSSLDNHEQASGDSCGVPDTEPYSKKIITNASSEFNKSALESHHTPDFQHTASRDRIEEGCLFIIFNQNNPSLSYPQRRWLSERLNGEEIWRQLELNETTFGAEIAHNFFPFWHNVKQIRSQQTELPRSVQIACYSHLGVQRSAKAAAQILSKAGIEAQINLYSFEVFIEKAQGDGFTEEIVMSSLNLDDNRQVSALLYFLSDPVLHATIGSDVSEWLVVELNRIRENFSPNEYLNQLEQLGSVLIYEGLITPMLHHRQTLSFLDIFKGVKITAWGWPKLSEIW